MDCVDLHAYANYRKSKNFKSAKRTLYMALRQQPKYLLVCFNLFLVGSVKIPKHQTNTNAIFTEKVMNRFHEVNELYDDTLNTIHNSFYSTDITTHKTFTFREAMKQEYRLSFLEAVEKKICDHEEGGHWTVEVLPLHILKQMFFARSTKITNPVLKWPLGKNSLPEQSTLP